VTPISIPTTFAYRNELELWQSSLMMISRSVSTKRRAILSVALSLLWIALGHAGHNSPRPTPQTGSAKATPQSPAATNVLFLCPHGAAKSVLASAYFQRAAKERGLTVRVDSAGIEPQDALAPVVVDHLRKNGYELPITKPRAVTGHDVESADVVVSMGCDLASLPIDGKTLEKWDDVPGPSEDFAGADKIIRHHVNALVDALIARQRK
jgi:arsenate reductase